MDDDQQRKLFFRLLPERRGDRIGQFLAVDIGQDLHALEAELRMTLQFLGGLLAMRQRHGAERDQPVGLAAQYSAMPSLTICAALHGDVDRQRIIALAGRRQDHLHVDAHGVEIPCSRGSNSTMRVFMSSFCLALTAPYLGRHELVESGAGEIGVLGDIGAGLREWRYARGCRW